MITYRTFNKGRYHKQTETRSKTSIDNRLERADKDSSESQIYKIEVKEGNITITANAKYDDGTELTERDKGYVA